LLRGLEQPRRSTLADHVHRPSQLGPWVLINESWYEQRAEGPAKSLKERGGHGRLVMFDVTDSREDPAMTQIEAKPAIASVNELFSKSPDGLQ
jgi:hypothetical protein